MERKHAHHWRIKKKDATDNREVNTALILLRAVEIGITIDDLDKLSIGMLLDIFRERARDYDDSDNSREATQEDFDNF